MKVNRRVAWAASFVAFIAYAQLASSIGPSLPAIRSEFDLTTDLAGLILGLSSLTGLLAVFGGVASDVLGRGFLSVVSLASYMVASASIALSPNLAVWAASFLVFSALAGFIEASVNSYVSGLFEDRRGLAVTLLHISWNIGSTLGPATATLALTFLGSWRPAYLLPLPLLISSIILIAYSCKGENREGRLHVDLVRLLKHILSLGPLLLITVSDIALEIGLNNWLPSILELQGLPVFESGFSLSLFWGLMGVGRLVWAPIVDRMGYWRTLLASSLLSVFSSSSAVLSASVYFKAYLWGFLGFSLAPVFPVIIAWATSIQPDLGGFSSGLIFSVGSFGAALSSYLIGYFASLLGVEASQLVLLGFSAVMLGSTVASRRVNP